MVRIALVVTLAEWGGAQAYVYELARAASQSYQVTVLCGPGRVLVERLRADGIRVVEIPAFRRAPHPLRDAQALAQLIGVLRRERVDLVHANSTKAGLLGRLAARAARVRAVIFTAHGWPFTEGRPGWMRWLLARTEAAGARLSTRIICVSEHDRRLAVQVGVATADRMTVIYNGADPMVPDALVPPPGLDAAPRPRTVMVGRLAPAKNPGSLLEAFRALTGGSLIFVGSGPLRPRLEESVRRHGLGGRVLFLGWRDDVAAILRAADIFALPSRWEGLPFAVIEAMMAELPVVATGVGGVPELVDEGRTGLLVPTESPGALAQALRRVAEDPSLRRRMGQAGRARALARFTVERMVRETLEVYRSVLGGEAAGGQDSGLSGRTL